MFSEQMNVPISRVANFRWIGLVAMSTQVFQDADFLIFWKQLNKVLIIKNVCCKIRFLKLYLCLIRLTSTLTEL